MKNFGKYLFIFPILFFSNLALGESLELGNETIKPLRFPKFIVGGEYVVNRRVVVHNGGGFSGSLANAIGINLHAEAGLKKYLNAGLTFSFTLSSPFLESGNVVRMNLYAKPYLPISDRLALFSRVSFGPSISLNHEGLSLPILATAGGGIKSSDRAKKMLPAYAEVFGTKKYFPISAGFTAGISIGMEYFFTKRLGLVIEGGYRVDMLWAKGLGLGEEVVPPTSGKEAPNWISLRYQGIPIMASINIIL